MVIRARLVWKLSAAMAGILAAAILFSGYVNSLIGSHYCLESARASLRFNSESIVKAIGQQMMSRNNQGVETLIGEISRGNTLYRDIQLVSHHSGQVVASRFKRDKSKLALGDRACAVCHQPGDLRDAEGKIVDAVIDLPEGGRALSVVAPIVNEPGCRNAACHAHASAPPILGFLDADYSLQPVDEMLAQRRFLIFATVFASLALGMIALWLMFTLLLERPIRALIAGTQRIAANQLDFRFKQKRRDEIGLLEESFNAMTGSAALWSTSEGSWRTPPTSS
jgi:two-component system NtrC family sensor kinase